MSKAQNLGTLIPLLLAACGGCAAAQAPAPATVILKAGTVLLISNYDTITPRTAKLGDVVVFHLVPPLAVGDQLLLPRWLELKGKVTALKPKFEVTLDPLQYGGATIEFAGHPFERKPKDTSWMASELDVQPPRSNSSKAGSVLANALYLPNTIMLLASPILVPMSLAMNHGKIWGGTLSAVTVANDTPLQPTPVKPYTGLPILYVRAAFWDNSLMCGNEPIPADFGTQYEFRVDPGSYPFHIPGPPPSAVTVEAKQDGRYLVFRDKAGLHAIDLATRPDLIEWLDEPSRERFGINDASKMPEQQAAREEDRARGGCGLLHDPKLRPIPTKPAKPSGDDED